MLNCSWMLHGKVTPLFHWTWSSDVTDTKASTQGLFATKRKAVSYFFQRISFLRIQQLTMWQTHRGGSSGCQSQQHCASVKWRQQWPCLVNGWEKSFISTSYYHSFYYLSFFPPLGLNHILPTLVQSESNQFPHPRPPMGLQFKHTHTPSHSNA